MYYIGIDLGGTNIAVGIVDESFKIVKKGSTPTLVNRDPELIIADMGKLCLELLAETGIGGAAKGKRLSVMITLGTGVGGGVIIDGKIYSGFNYAGAELGHTVIEYNGRQCSCGRKGCFEAYASATALVSMTKEKLAACKDTLMWEMCGNDINKADARIAFAAMKKGDRAGKEVVDMYISYLACGITNMINIFQPEVLLIGGGVCNEKDYLLKPLTEIVNADQYTRNQAVKTEIKIAALGNDAGIVGAAALGR